MSDRASRRPTRQQRRGQQAQSSPPSRGEYPRWAAAILSVFTVALVVGTVLALYLRWPSLNANLVYLYAGLLTVYLVAENRAHVSQTVIGERSHEPLRYALALFWWALMIGSLLEYALWPRYLPYVTVLGAALAGLGIALRVWSVHTLGQGFSGHIEVQPSQQLIVTG
ncbi:MAG: hypothetical protein ACYC1C_19510, partial [Chloroflexota bacterium]